MTRRQRAWTWVTDWRNGATLAASLFMVVVLLVVADAVDGRRQAFAALEEQSAQLRESRQAASRRIDLLQARIDELVGRGETNAQALGALLAEVAALQEQVRLLGGEPIVVRVAAPQGSAPPPERSTTTTAPQPPGHTPPAPPSPSTTTTTTAPPRPTTPIPFPCQTLFVPILCTEGAP